MKITKKDLAMYIENYIAKKFENTVTPVMIDEKITKKDIITMIEEAIHAKLTGEAYDTVKQLEDSIKVAFQKLTKSSVDGGWVKDVERLREKGEGTYQVEIIGSGNVKVIVKWNKTPQKNMFFELVCSEPCIAGDPYKENAYKFMCSLLLKKEKVLELLQDVIKSLGSIGKEMRSDEDEGDEIPKPAPKPVSAPAPMPAPDPTPAPTSSAAPAQPSMGKKPAPTAA
jgi:hypothetical protein